MNERSTNFGMQQRQTIVGNPRLFAYRKTHDFAAAAKFFKARLTSNAVRGFCLSACCHSFSIYLPGFCQQFLKFLSGVFGGFMSEQKQFEEIKLRLKGRVNGYRAKLSPKNALLFAFKTEIKELRERNAAYDDIRLILAEENIIVSINTLYRFCRDVLGEKSDGPHKSRAPKYSPPKISPMPSPPANTQTSIQAALQERRERLPSLWGRRKRGPHIADSKNL